MLEANLGSLNERMNIRSQYLKVTNLLQIILNPLFICAILTYNRYENSN